MKKSLLALALAGALSQVQAADDLGTIVVSAARTPQSELSTPASITVITREEIERSAAQNLAELLRGRSSVVVTDLFGDGSRASIDMRGFGNAAGSNVLVLVDGRRLNNVDLSNPALNSIRLGEVERIEIVEGSAGTLFGDQAVGGVINIITRTPRKPSGQLSAGVGSYNRRQIEARYGNRLSNGFDYRIGAQLRHSDNYRDHNAVDYRNLDGRLGWSHASGEVFLDFQNLYEDLELPGALNQAQFEADPRQSLSWFAEDFTRTWLKVGRIGLRQDLGSRLRFEGEVSRRNEDRQIQQSFVGFPVLTPSWLRYRQTELTPRLVLDLPAHHGEMQLVLGYDGTRTDYRSEITNIEDRQQKQALYLQATLPGPHGLGLTLGARHGRVSDDVSATYKTGRVDKSVTVATIGLNWRVNSHLRLFLRRDGNYRFAKVDELTYTSPGVELKPQTGVSWETGAQWQARNHHLKLTFYRLSLKDEIAFDPSAPPPTGAFFPGANVNFDPTTHQGVILNAGFETERGTRVEGSWNVVDATFDSGVFSGNRIGGVPEQQLRVSLDQAFPAAFRLRLEGIYRGAAYLAGDNANALPEQGGYTIYNAVLDWQRKNLQLALRINNLADKRYAESRNSYGAVFPSPGRNAWLTLAYDF